jgi:RNA polymerase sigma-70 factor (ECF subfamily)
VRTCYDFWRRKYRSKEVPVSRVTDDHLKWLEMVTAEASRENFEDMGRRREAGEILDWALSHLSPEDRMVMELVHLEERSVREAAALLGWSAANVKVRAFRSRKKLKRLIAASGRYQ